MEDRDYEYELWILKHRNRRRARRRNLLRTCYGYALLATFMTAVCFLDSESMLPVALVIITTLLGTAHLYIEGDL